MRASDSIRAKRTSNDQRQERMRRKFLIRLGLGLTTTLGAVAVAAFIGIGSTHNPDVNHRHRLLVAAPGNTADWRAEDARFDKHDASRLRHAIDRHGEARASAACRRSVRGAAKDAQACPGPQAAERHL